MLDAVDPMTFINAAISPIHLTVALSDIHVIIPFIDVATFPSELTIPVFVIIKIVSDVLIHRMR